MPGSRVARVYIGRIPNSCREKDLDRFFKGYGHLKDILIKNGYGFVEFEDYRDADDAVYELNGKDLLGERVTVEHAKGVARRGPPMREREREPSRRPVWLDRYGPPVRTPYQVIVENLSSKISWQDLKDYMRKGGEVSYADAHRHRRNEGIVEFASYSDMKRAINKMDGADLNGRRIRIVSQYRKSRSRSRHRRSRSRRSDSTSRSRSRSRSKSRSRSRSKWSRSRSRDRSRSRSKSRGRSRSKSKGRSRSKSMDRSRGRSHSKEGSQRRSTSKRESSTRESMQVVDKADEEMRSQSRSPRQSRSPSRNSDESSHSNTEKRSRSPSQSNDNSPKRQRSVSPEDRENGYSSS